MAAVASVSDVAKLDLVGLPEIADMLGKHPQTVQDWSSKGGILPTPEAVVARRTPVWRRSTIERWARKTGRWPK